MAQDVETKQSTYLDSIPWDKLTDTDLTRLKKLAAEKAKEREHPFMSAVKVNLYKSSAEKAVTRLLQIYRLLNEGDETGKGATEKDKAVFLAECDKLSPNRIAEEAAKLPKVTQLRQGGGRKSKQPATPPKGTKA
jgi:hypothetical protein